MPLFPRSATLPPWLPLACAIAALVLAATGVAAGALWWPGFSHASHPLALPGAGGVPGAAGYNLLVFVVPGLLAALLAEWRYAALQASAGWGPRIGARLLLVAAVAWAAQGVFTLDLHELDGPDGQLHAAAWTCWWLAGSSGLLLLGAGVRRARVSAWTIGLLLCLLALLPQWPWPAAFSQRLAALAWFGWWLAWAARRWRGRAASGLH